VDNDAKRQVTIIQEDAASERADKDREAKLAVAALSAKFETMQNAMTLLQSEIARIGSQQHAVAMAGADAHHEHQMALLNQQHAAYMGRQGAEAAMLQNEQTAALNPPPESEPSTQEPL